MSLPSRASLLLRGVFALLLTACPGDDADDSTTAAASTGASGTGDPTTADPSTGTPGTTEGTTADPASTGAETTSDPSDTTAADSSGGSTGQVVMETTLGTIVIQLDEAAAPITTANFLAYVESGFYDGNDGDEPTIVHRVVPGFVIQAGGLREDLTTKPTMPPIVNESSNGLSNLRGTLSMARTSDPNSATSQFFINLVDNTFLDEPPGYAVFGEVVEGMEVVDAIAAVPTATMGPYDDVPVEPVLILSATVQ